MRRIIGHIRCLFYFIGVDPPRLWWYWFRYGPRIQIFCTTRGTVIRRWGGQILGLTIGDRGNARDFYMRQWGFK